MKDRIINRLLKIFKGYKLLKNSDNIMFLSGEDCRAMVLCKIPLPEVVIKSIDKEKKTAQICCVNNEYKKSLLDRCITFNDEIIGVIRKNENKENECFAQLFYANRPDTADICTMLENVGYAENKIFGKNIFLEIPLIFAEKCGILLKDKNVCFAFSFSDEGLISALKQIAPEKAAFCYPAAADNSFSLENGAGFVLKDGGFMLNLEVKENALKRIKEKDIKAQMFAKSQSDIVLKLSVFGNCKDTFGITVPVEYYETACPVADIKDIENAARLTEILTEG